MNSIIPTSAVDLFVISMGVYLICAGWHIYSLRSKKLLVTTRISLFILQLVKGRDAREEKEKELTEPGNIRKYGVSTIAVGAFLILQALVRLLITM
jgi:hypothetical protein